MANLNFSDDYVNDCIRKLDIHFDGWFTHLLNSRDILPDKELNFLILLSSCINSVLNSFEPYGKA